MNKNGVKDQHFYGHGKLLLSAEYFVLDGALSLALPTTVGQSLNVKYRPSYEPYLYWKSYNREGKLWFEAKFEFWHFNLVQTLASPEALLLEKILKQVRNQNSHFLRDEVDVFVETRLEFPLTWGLGASSTLIHNISQWACVGSFELLFKTMGGSGYDIACAQSQGPILYKKSLHGPKWSMVYFDPPFKEYLYFVQLGKKQNTLEAINFYKSNNFGRKEHLISGLSNLTRQFVESKNLFDFERVLCEHEDLVSRTLGLKKVKDTLFSDYWGEVKSLGAWGGDFVLVTGYGKREKIQKYFAEKGYDVFIPFHELIRWSPGTLSSLSPMKNLIDPFFEDRHEDI